MTVARIQDVIAGFQAAGASDAAIDRKATSAQRAAGLTFMDFGAAGNGSTPDDAAILAALAHSRDNGVKISGGGRTYLLSAPLVHSGAFDIDNATCVAAPGFPTGAIYALQFVGASFDAAQAITAAIAQGDTTIQCPGHGYSRGDVVLIQSDDLFETITNSRRSYWTRVSSTTADSFTAQHAAPFNIPANNLRAQRLPSAGKARVGPNVRVIGPGAGSTSAISIVRHVEPEIGDGLFIDGHRARGVLFSQCYAPKSGRVTVRNCDLDGFGTGMGVSGSGHSVIGDVEGHRCRHILSYGASSGIVANSGVYASVLGSECLGAAFDTHPGAFDIQQTGRTIAEMSSELVSGSEDGITLQGAGGSCFATIAGPVPRHVLLVQYQHVAGLFTAPPDVVVEVSGRTNNGKLVSIALSSGNVGAFRMRADGYGSTGSIIAALTGNATLGSLEVSGDMATAGASLGIRITTAAGSSLGRMTFQGRSKAAGTDNLYITADAGAPRMRLHITGSELSGAQRAVRLDGPIDGYQGANLLQGTSLATLMANGATLA